MTEQEKAALIARTDGKLISEISTGDLRLLIELQPTEVQRHSMQVHYQDRAPEYWKL